jgi:hypothetical protein
MAGNKTFVADVKQFAKLTQEAMAKVARDSIQDVMEGAMTSARGVSVGGTLIEGRIPVASSVLIKSLKTDIVSGGTFQGQDSYTVALANYKLGDVLSFQWTADYAIYVEMGTSKFPGWHFVGRNAARWPEIVANNVRLHRVD